MFWDIMLDSPIHFRWDKHHSGSYILVPTIQECPKKVTRLKSFRNHFWAVSRFLHSWIVGTSIFRIASFTFEPSKNNNKISHY